MRIEKKVEKMRLTSWRPARRKKSIYFWLVLVQYVFMLFIVMVLLLWFGAWELFLIGLVPVNGWFITDLWRQVTDAAEARTPEAKIGDSPAYTVKRFFPKNLSHTLYWVDKDSKVHKRSVISEFVPTGGWLDVPHDDGHPNPLIVATAWDSRMEKEKKEEQRDVEIPEEVKDAIAKAGGRPIEKRHVFAGRFQGRQYYIPCDPVLLVQIRDLPPDMRRFAIGLDESYTLETPVLWGPDRMEEPHKIGAAYESNLAWELLDVNRQLDDERAKNENLRDEIQDIYAMRGMYHDPSEGRKSPPGVR